MSTTLATIISLKAKDTVPTVALLEVINTGREEPLRHDHFMEQLAEYRKDYASTYVDEGGRTYPCLRLPQKEALQVLATKGFPVQSVLYDQFQTLLKAFVSLQDALLVTREEFCGMEATMHAEAYRRAHPRTKSTDAEYQRALAEAECRFEGQHIEGYDALRPLLAGRGLTTIAPPNTTRVPLPSQKGLAQLVQIERAATKGHKRPESP